MILLIFVVFFTVIFAFLPTVSDKFFLLSETAFTFASPVCTTVISFKDVHTGKFEEIMLIRNDNDLWAFKNKYGLEGEIEKEY